MLWVALVGLLVLQNAAAQAQNPICKIFTEAKEDGFRALALVGLSQNLPVSTLAELAPLIDEAQALGTKCCSDAPPADCDRDAADLFQSAVCSSETLVEKNSLKPCCEMSGVKRTLCFVDHKSKIPQDRSLMQELPAQEQCDDFKKDGKVVVGKFIFTFSKRNVLLPPQVVLAIAKGYGDVLIACCADADAQTCFDTKKAAFQVAVKARVTALKSICIIYNKFGSRIVKAKKLIQYSQKIPQATLDEAITIIKKIADTAAPCCGGDMITCMKERKELIDEVCANASLVTRTTGLAACCQQSAVERGDCMEMMKPDPKPEGLSDHYDIHANLPAICDTFTKLPDQAMGTLMYEVARRHPESSQQVILRFGREAEQALTQCCGKEDQAECVKTALAESDVEKMITDGIAYFTTMWVFKALVGRQTFEKSMMEQYTRKMPQASFDLINVASEAMADVIDECCKKDPDHFVLPCAEEKMTNILDTTCNDYDTSSINPRIAHCCNQSYSTRRGCVLAILPDTEFQSPALDPSNFQMGPHLCTQSGKDLLLSEKKLLYGLVRHKTTITKEQLETISAKYQAMRKTCCVPENQDACFLIEGPKLIAESAELLKA